MAPKMAISSTATIDPAGQQQTSAGTDDVTESRQKSTDQTFSGSDPHHADNNSDKKPLWRLILVTVALLTGVFFVALDVNILGWFFPC